MQGEKANGSSMVIQNCLAVPVDVVHPRMGLNEAIVVDVVILGRANFSQVVHGAHPTRDVLITSG